MNIIPFFSKKYEIGLELVDVLKRIKQNTKSQTWKVDLEGLVNNRVFESEIYFDSFIVIMGRYGLSYGRTSLLPILKGKITRDKEKQSFRLNIVIRLFGSAIAMMSFFYGIVFVGITLGIYRRDFNLIGFLLFFFGITYGSIMLKFNREKQVYIDFLEKNILAGNFKVK